MKTKINGVDVEIEKCHLLFSSPKDNFISYENKLEALKFPVGISLDILFEKYTIDRLTCK